jgi:hypothetical protein
MLPSTGIYIRRRSLGSSAITIPISFVLFGGEQCTTTPSSAGHTKTSLPTPSVAFVWSQDSNVPLCKYERHKGIAQSSSWSCRTISALQTGTKSTDHQAYSQTTKNQEIKIQYTNNQPAIITMCRIVKFYNQRCAQVCYHANHATSCQPSPHCAHKCPVYSFRRIRDWSYVALAWSARRWRNG